MGSSIAEAESWSSSPNLKWSYDVFLSFRGEDTRSNFTSHLDMALRQKGVNFFIDDKLDRGGQISESLLKSIQGSRISIIIFSQNYASSSWCLDELVKIIECMKSKGQIALPVFYKVDPSEVRKQTGGFGEALAKHEAKFMSTKIQTWKEALTTAAGLSGWDLGTRKEADLIEDLVKEVLSKLNSTQLLYVAKHPIGIVSQLEAMELASHVVSDCIHMVGIYGMGGIGKTTLAKTLYNKIAHQFEGCSFLSNVREASQQLNGLVQLQEKLLYEILKDNLKVGNIDKGINIIRGRLCSKKVLILLDDVHDPKQLEALVGGRDWFGRGSKIIVTTRDRNLLSNHEFDVIHPVQELDPNKSLELFSWHAFKKNHPSSDYLDLSELAVGYCNGLPLALVILGSLLHKRERIIWKSKLDELENFLEPSIEDVFQISFKGLQDKVKEIFLDISCLFVGEDVNSVKDMLRACDLHPDYGITVLMDLSLVTVEDGKIRMHDLIQQMGQTIVFRESSEPEKRSRLWEAEEVINMLEENVGTDAIKVIKLDFVDREPVTIDPKAFRNMKNLRLLILRSIPFSRNIFECLPNKLKWIDYSGSIITGSHVSLPPSFFVNDQLVGLNVQHSYIKHLGNRFENCKRLKHVDLSFCTDMEEIPDFSATLNLEKLYLKSCNSLKRIHESVGSLSKLITLDLQDCSKLEKLPSILMLESLETLNLRKCKKLEEIPDFSAASNLKILCLRGCSNLRIIHETVGRSLNKLEILDLENCYKLESLPSYVMSESLQILNFSHCQIPKKSPNFSLKKFRSHLKCLKVLDLSGCYTLEEITDFSAASNLEQLNLSLCVSLRMIDESIGSLDKLVRLDLSYCDDLVMLPNFSAALNLVELYLFSCKSLTTVHESIGSLGKLVSLNLENCSNLEKLPSYLKLKSLISLLLSGCKKLEELPEFDENMKSLREMKLSDTAIKELPPSVKHLTGLENLSLECCVELIALPSEIYLLKSLKKLRLRGCSKLDMFPPITSSLNFPQESLLSKLTKLDLKNCNISNADHFSDTLSNACTSLIELTLSGNKFSCLPSLHKFTSLQHLILKNCEFLQNIPNLPQCLEIVDISGCKSFVIRPDNIADIISRSKQQELELGDSRIRELVIVMNGEMSKFFKNQIREIGSVEHNPNKRQDLVVWHVFEVDDVHYLIDYEVFIDGKRSDYCVEKTSKPSKSDYMWLITIPLPYECLEKIQEILSE